MIKKYLILSILVCCISPLLKAQQYGLFNTRTLFDGFENPAQQTFVLDSSRKFASNFFLPYFGIHAAAKGSEDFLRRVISEGKSNASELPLRTGEINTLYQHSNVYLLTLKIFQSHKFQKELGFSWQLRSDAHIDYTNETLAILDTYKRFDTNPYEDVFNDDGYAQSYHQFSVTYRENFNKRLAFGAKLSLLSGITYNQLNISDSYFEIDEVNDRINVSLRGTYKANFRKTDELSSDNLIPNFRNPGMAFSFGTSYKSKKGVFIMANVKDLGFIKWRKTVSVNRINAAVNIENASVKTPRQVENEITDLAIEDSKIQNFYSATNAKLDFMISKGFEISYPLSYTPSLIVSKNVFYKGGDAVFVNKFQFNKISFSAIPSYNFNGLFLVGMQGMYQTPNFEVFLGSDNLTKTIAQAQGVIASDWNIGSGYNAASIYMGFGIKFGNTVEHPQNSSSMPGIGEQQRSFFKRLFSIFSKK